MDSSSTLSHSPAEQIRSAFARWVNERTGDPVTEIQEMMLIRQGFYCGRRYSSSGFSAVWFVEESQIKLLDHDGQSLGTMTMSAFLQTPSATALPKAA